MATLFPETLPLLPEAKVIHDGYTWAGEAADADAPEQTGTIFSSSMNLSACALGASMLSLPYAMLLSGPLAALGVLVLFGAMAYFAAQAVVHAGLRCARSQYADIVRYFFGAGQGALCDGLLAFALALAAISYMVGLAELLPTLIPPTAAASKAVRIAGVLALLYPVTLVSSLASFGPASAMATAGCYIQAAALVLMLFTTEWSLPSPGTLFAVSPAGLLYSLPYVCFVYAFHYVLTDTLAEVEQPTEKRLALVSLSTVGVLLGCYMPVAISGYLALSGENIPDNLLKGLPASSPVVGIARWSIALLLFCTYSLFIIPLRRKVEDVVLGEQTGAMTDPRRLVIAGGLMLGIGLVSISLPSLGLANSIAGGCIAIVMFYFPGALMWRMEMDLPTSERDRFQLVCGAFFMITGVTVCIMGLFGDMIFDFS